MKTNILIFALAAIVLSSCGSGEKKKNSDNDTTAVQTVVVPEFNSDSAHAYVAKQVAFGPRVPGSSVQLVCRDWLVSELKRHGAEVTVQEASVRAYNNTILPCYNIIGSINPDAKSRIMLSSHWDSRPYADWDLDPANHSKPIPGANDGASGVGILLEIARVLGEHTPSIGVDIVFWDVEDYGEPKDNQGQEKEDTWGLGSQYWSKNLHKVGYNARYGILLDMTGATNATFYQEGFSMRFAPGIMRKVWDHAHALGYEKYFLNEEANPIMDDHYYVNKYANIPTIDIIHQDKNSETGFYPYWHTMQDDIDKIDKATLKVVGQTLLRTIFYEK